MKKIRIITVITIILIFSSLNACISKEAVEVTNVENIESEKPVSAEDQTIHKEVKDIVTEERQTAKDIFEKFLANEVQAALFGDERYYYRDIESEFEIDKHEYRDVDNDGEEELLIYSEIYFYPVMVLDVNGGEIEELCSGGGTAEYLSFYDVDGVTWSCFSDTTHQGRQFYYFKQYRGTRIVDEFSLSAEYWENEDDRYDENSVFMYRDKKISMEEYEELLEKWNGIKQDKSTLKIYPTALDMYDAVLKDIIAGERIIYDGGESVNYGNSVNPGYSLYDIDMDGTPELFITDDIYSDPHIFTVYYWKKNKEVYDTVKAGLTGYIPEKEWWVYAHQVGIDVCTYDSNEGFKTVLELSYPWENDDIYEIYHADESLSDITNEEVTKIFEGKINEPIGINWIKLTDDFDLDEPDKEPSDDEE